MPVTLRLVQGTPLTYTQGDENFSYLLTNMSGSALSLTGPTSITGSLNVSSVAQGTSETKILVTDNNGNFKYRTDLSLQGVQGRFFFYRYMRQHTTLSLKVLATFICNHDHSTVIYALKKFDDLYNTDKQFRHDYNEIINKIEL